MDEMKRTSFYIDKKMLKQVKLRCVLLEINQSDFIRQAIQHELEREIPQEDNPQKTIEEATGLEFTVNEKYKNYKQIGVKNQDKTIKTEIK